MVKPWTQAELYRLARSGAVKCDVGGIRGATLVSTEEQLAMAAVLLTSGALPPPDELNRMIAAEEAGTATETTKAEGA